MSSVPKHRTFIQRKKCETDLHNLNLALQPYYEILEEALPCLDKILEELRGDTSTSQEFQNCLCEILDEGNYSSKTLCQLMLEYAKTHNHSNSPNRKPVVSIAQQAHKIIDNIDDILLAMTSMEDQKNSLSYIISNLV